MHNPDIYNMNSSIPLAAKKLEVLVPLANRNWIFVSLARIATTGELN